MFERQYIDQRSLAQGPATALLKAGAAGARTLAGASVPPDGGWRPLRTDINGANLAAGVTAGLWYAFGSVSVQLDAAARLHLAPEAASSWLFIVWFTCGVSGLLLTLRFKQPLAIGWTVPGLAFLATTGDRYTLPERAGASLAAGVIIVALGLSGFGKRLMRWLPLPIVMGMFAGSVLSYATGIFAHFGAQPGVVGAALLGYLGARALARPWLPPVGVAAVAGLVAATLPARSIPGPSAGACRRSRESGRASTRGASSPCRYRWSSWPLASATCQLSACS